MKYWLTTLSLISSIDDTIPASSPKPSSIVSSPVETPPINPSTYIYLKPKETDYQCLHRILSDSLIVYMTFIMSIRVLKNYSQLSRMNTTLMVLESKDSPPPPSINS